MQKYTSKAALEEPDNWRLIQKTQLLKKKF